jgi:hypothetical protein
MAGQEQDFILAFSATLKLLNTVLEEGAVYKDAKGSGKRHAFLLIGFQEAQITDIETESTT